MTPTLPYGDAQVVASWRRNAGPWTIAVREQQIESRRLVTDAAIVAAVRSRAPQSLLDAGCGEGWLLRTLAAEVPVRVGTDVIPELIAHAQAAGGGDFRIAAYEDLAAGALAARFDVVACNFALIGEQSVVALIGALRALLKPRGAFIMQTLHPLMACGEQPYEDGWRPGSWDGFAPVFTDPAPWYFRTLSGWLRLLAAHGLRLAELREPLHPASARPASLLLVAEAAD